MRRPTSLAKLLAIASFAVAFGAQAQHHPTSAGHPLKEGSKAPSFTLTDQNGQDQSLDAMLKNGKAAVIFHRSADW